MALTTTPGSATADSVATLAETNTYHSDRGNIAWTGTDTLKEAALRRAMTWLDTTYRARFPGYRTDDRDQNLEWPRTNAYDIAGELIAVDEIPIEMKRSQMEAALRELVAPGSLSPDFVAAGEVRSESVGPISQEFFASGGSSSVLPVIHIVDGILAGLIGSAVAFVARA